jgi:hypothetical protein
MKLSSIPFSILPFARRLGAEDKKRAFNQAMNPILENLYA